MHFRSHYAVNVVRKRWRCTVCVELSVFQCYTLTSSPLLSLFPHLQYHPCTLTSSQVSYSQSLQCSLRLPQHLLTQSQTVPQSLRPSWRENPHRRLLSCSSRRRFCSFFTFLKYILSLKVIKGCSLRTHVRARRLSAMQKGCVGCHPFLCT